MRRLRQPLCALMLSWLVACSPEKTEGLPATQASSTVSNEAVVGAWTLADAFSPEVQEAARFAVQTFAVQNKARVLFKEVTHARQQVVAGLNFQLQLHVTLDGALKNVNVTVWRQLDGDYRLQSWDWVD